MPVIFNLIFLCIFLCICVGSVWGAWAIAALFLAKGRWRAALLGIPVSFLVVGFAVAGYVFWVTRPSHIFKQEFGFDAPNDTRVDNGHSFALGDSASAYLRFHTSRQTLNKILGGQYVVGSPLFGHSDEPPTWFQPMGESYYRELNAGSSHPYVPNQALAYEMRILHFDPATGDAWYEYHGVD